MIRDKVKIYKAICLLCWPLSFFIAWRATFHPITVEKYYTKYFSKPLAEYLSQVTGIFPFSVAEITCWLLAIGLLGLLIKNITHRQAVLKFTYIVLIVLGVIYFCFNILWGLNYHRLTFAAIAGLEVQESTAQELEKLCENLAINASNLRENLPVDERGVMTISGGFQEIREKSPEFYMKASLIYPELGGRFGKPKPVLLSKGMSYTGISGIYFPFTGEANVNIDIPEVILPATTLHEMAHQRGFAREDEANFIAWLVSQHSEDPIFQYSGTVSALIYSVNALYACDPEKAKSVATKYSEGLRRDLQAISSYWKKYEGKLEEISSDINDAYLKSNHQKQGVQSYGGMVDLLLAQQRAVEIKEE